MQSLHGATPGLIDQRGFISLGGAQQANETMRQFGLSGGLGDSVGAQGITPLPELSENTTAIIRDNDGDGKHSWDEADLTQDARFPTIAGGGRRGLIPVHNPNSSSSSDEDHYDQEACSPNGINYDPGTVVRIYRANSLQWAIIDTLPGTASSEQPSSEQSSGSSGGTSSNPGGMTFTCNSEGTGGTITPNH